jgi:hypothetical protein
VIAINTLLNILNKRMTIIEYANKPQGKRYLIEFIERLLKCDQIWITITSIVDEYSRRYNISEDELELFNVANDLIAYLQREDITYSMNEMLNCARLNDNRMYS